MGVAIIKQMRVFVQALSNPVIQLDINSNTKISELKALIQDLTGLPAADQVHILSGKCLSDDRTLSESGISCYETIRVNLRLCGGGGMSGINTADIKHAQGSSGLPSYRNAGVGINIDGICTNPSCTAHNKYVIYQHGMRPYCPAVDEAKCPMCQSKIEMKRLWFSQCRWRFLSLVDGECVTHEWHEVPTDFDRVDRDGPNLPSAEKILEFDAEEIN